MKVILPVAGIGTRLRPLTLHLPKCLLPVAGNTILGHILDALTYLDISEYIFVTGYQAEKVEEYIKKSYPQIESRFVQQENPQGLGEAIHLCTPFLDENEATLIILGDTLYDADLKSLVHSETNILCTRTVDDPSRFGVAISSPDGKISRLVEKPQDFVSDQALVGIYFIRSVKAMTQALQHLMDKNIRTRGEYQFTDALQIMIEQKCDFYTGQIRGWLDCGKPETLLETNRLLLSRKEGKNKSYPGTIITEPCYIASDVKISNSIIGPNVSLHKGSVVKDSMLKDSVVAANCFIKDCGLEGSILGESATVCRFHGSLNLGDYSQINSED
ncbi:MAG: NTP transferase domain-containing protein [Fibrobacter sp.]|nr:NTP transferase domain-containing protein [Fibrobacter sp.]